MVCYPCPRPDKSIMHYCRRQTDARARCAVRVSGLISKHQTVDDAIKAIVEAASKQHEADLAAGVEQPPLREGEEERIEFSAGRSPPTHACTI